MVQCYLALRKEEFQKGIKRLKIKNVPGGTINDIYDYVKPLLKKYPDNIILHAVEVVLQRCS